MSFINTNKLLIITWVVLALLIGLGIGYLLGGQGFGQKVQNPNFQPGGGQPSQQNFGPGSQGEAPAGAPGGRNPVPNGGTQTLPQQSGQ